MRIYDIKKLEAQINKISLSGVYSGWKDDSKMFFSVKFIDNNKEQVEITFGKERKTNSPAIVKKYKISSLRNNEYILDSLKNDALEKENNYINIDVFKGLLF